MEDKRVGVIYCEICSMKPATEIKGGVYNNLRDMWLICKECKKKIGDMRRNGE